MRKSIAGIGSVGVAVLGVVVVLALVAGPAAAQIPERLTNLRVLPKDISRKDLVQTMRAWTSALGVRCGHCHTGGNPETLEGVDFASDAKWEKRTARSMFRMLHAIEGDYLRKLEARPVVAGATPVASASLTCMTCHHGLARPETLDDVLERIVRAEGAEAAVRTYKDLRSKYLGRGSYDFSERSVNTLAERLMQEKRPRDAAVLLEASAEFNPDAAWLRHLLGEARLAEGDRAGARSAFARALALNPENSLTRKRLEELGGGAEALHEGSFLLALEPHHSTLGFSVGIAGGLTRVTGKFKELSGRIVMNEGHLDRCSVEITAQAASVDTGIDERDAHLRQAEFLDAAAHPLVTFKSARIESTAEGYRAVGALTMRGTTKEVAIPFHTTGLEWKEGKPLLGIAGQVTLRRSDFGVGTTWRHSSIPDFLSDEVVVEIFVWTRLGQPVPEGS